MIDEGEIQYKYSAGIGVSEWRMMLSKPDIFTKKDLKLLKICYEAPDYCINAKEVYPRFGYTHHAPINMLVSNLSKRICKYLAIQPPVKNQKGKPRWWHILFLGMEGKEFFYWILRPELVEAYRQYRKGGEEENSMSFFENDVDNIVISYIEGERKEVKSKRIERNIKAREACIKYYGSVCYVCGFDFEENYGEIGKGKIHVHHLQPISSISKEYKVNPIEDLRPVCPNCHYVIHLKYPPYAIEEVKKFVRYRKL